MYPSFNAKCGFNLSVKFGSWVLNPKTDYNFKSTDKLLSFSAFLQFTHPIESIKATDMRGTLENFQSVLLTGSLILKANKTHLCDFLSPPFYTSFLADIFKAVFPTSLPICFPKS